MKYAEEVLDLSLQVADRLNYMPCLLIEVPDHKLQLPDLILRERRDLAEFKPGIYASLEVHPSFGNHCNRLHCFEVIAELLESELCSRVNKKLR